MTSEGSAGPIVVGVDGSAGALGAARWAAALAERVAAPLHFLTATPCLGHLPSNAAAAMRVAAIADHREYADRYLTTARDVVLAEHPEVNVTTASCDEPADQALATATRTARLLVLGCEDLTATGAVLIGSTTLATVEHSQCPIVAWRGEVTIPNGHPVVVGVDGSDDDGGALNTAFSLAGQLDAPLRVIHCWSSKGHLAPSAAQVQWRHLHELVDARRENYRHTNVTLIGESAKPSHALMFQPTQAQLVVVGSRRRNPLARGLLGSTSLELLHHSKIPVVLCPFDPER
jgi:nucleotide-binding universal stress UspA family protein